MPWQQWVGIHESKTLHMIDDIMMLRDSWAIFFFLVDVGIVVYPLLVNNIVQLADELPAPCKRKVILAPTMQERSRQNKPVQ
jgi:hypothetical protein